MGPDPEVLVRGSWPLCDPFLDVFGILLPLFLVSLL